MSAGDRLFCLKCGAEVEYAHSSEVDGVDETAFTPMVLNPCGHTSGARVERSETYRIALRPDHLGELDDVVVSDVSMFRMERMSDTTVWLACYLEGTDGGDGCEDRITFHLHADKHGAIHEQPGEFPTTPGITYEAGSMQERGASR